MSQLNHIAQLSHEFGTQEYVLGGGGNASCKDRRTLWIKPSGTTLADIATGDFVALDRKKLGKVYTMKPPADASEREAKVKDGMLAAVRPESEGKRPSVETPLHDSFEATYVVHTHPALVNGLTCSQEGEAVCERLFPHALWIPYVDPGYKLSMHVRQAMSTVRNATGSEPAVVVIQNHGVFVAGSEPAAVRAAYARVMDTLRDEYAARDLSMELDVGDTPPVEHVIETQDAIRAVVGSDEAAFIVTDGPYEPASGPLTPDHIVYSRAFPLNGVPTKEALEAYREDYGVFPRVVVTEHAAYGLGTTEKNARLALELSKDAALVQQLAEAFGGVRFMDESARRFIENWEVEAYRRSVA
jgi:rhamnose utilization protein RhaD (predicted bifunctional aldolase and dehydrogenase)